MKAKWILLLLILLVSGCDKKNDNEVNVSELEMVNSETTNTGKVTITDADYKIITREPNYLVVEVWDLDMATFFVSDPNIEIRTLRRVIMKCPYTIIKEDSRNLEVIKKEEL